VWNCQVRSAVFHGVQKANTAKERKLDKGSVLGSICLPGEEGGARRREIMVY